MAEEALLRQGRGGKKSPPPASAEEALLRQVRGGEALGHKPRQGSESQKKVSSWQLWDQKIFYFLGRCDTACHRRERTNKNKGQRNPRRVLLRSLQLELKHRQRDIEDQIVRAKVQSAIDTAPWSDDRCEHNSDLLITRKYKYRSKACISQVVKLRSSPIRLIDAQEAEFAADFLEQERSEYSYYSDEEGVYLQEGQVAASSSKAAASSWAADPAQEAYDYYEGQAQQEERSSKLKEEAQSEYTYE